MKEDVREDCCAKLHRKQEVPLPKLAVDDVRQWRVDSDTQCHHDRPESEREHRVQTRAVGVAHLYRYVVAGRGLCLLGVTDKQYDQDETENRAGDGHEKGGVEPRNGCPGHAVWSGRHDTASNQRSGAEPEQSKGVEQAEVAPALAGRGVLVDECDGHRDGERGTDALERPHSQHGGVTAKDDVAGTADGDDTESEQQKAFALADPVGPPTGKRLTEAVQKPEQRENHPDE